MKNRIAIASATTMIVAMFFLIGCFGNQKSKEQETVKMGIVVPLSGNGAVLGSHSKQGAELAVEEINAKGGLLGKKIVLDIQDSKSEPKEGVSIIKKMVNEKQKPFMVYSIVSGVTMAMRPETESNKVILMAAVGTDKFMPNSNYTIRNYLSATSVAKYIVPYIKDSLKMNQIGIFYANNEYSTSVKNAVEEKGGKAGLSFQFSQPFDEKIPDYKSLVSGSITNNTKCVFIDGIGTGLGSIIKQIRETGYKGLIVTTPLVKFPDVLTAAGDAIKDVRYLDFSYTEGSAEYSNNVFVKNYRARYNSDPTNFAYISYEGVYLLLSKINSLQKLDTDVAVEAMNSVEDYEGVFGKISVHNREFEFSYAIKKF